MAKLIDTLFNHERYQTISVIIAATMLLWFYGCESTCPSLLDPSAKVNRTGLQMELDIIVARAEAGIADMDKQDRLKDMILQQAIAAGQAGTVNPLALITSIATILGIGAGADNVRKRIEIKKLTHS